MNKLQKILLEEIKIFINENVQLADKVYFNTNKLTPEDKNVILRITKGDNYTKLVSDIYYYMKKNRIEYNENSLIKRLTLIYGEIKNYNKNVFPIVDFDINNNQNNFILYALEYRRKIINEIKKLPSIAVRNLKNDIRVPRNYSELSNYLHDLEYFMGYYSLLYNRDEKTQLKIARKMFKADITLDDLMNFVDDKESFLGGVEFTRDNIIELSKTEDIEIIYEQGNIMIVRVETPEAIKAVGCNSLWCFTYGSGFENAYRQWNNYSHNDMVYVIINFNKESNSSEFMHVLIKPLINDNGRFIKYNDDDNDSYPIFDMGNDNFTNPYFILNDLFGDNYKQIIKKYLNFEY